jgi:diguanylate cyclase (GGDEF)-like protein
VEDFSAVKRLIDEVRLQGITDFRVFTDVHPEFVERCMAEIRVVDVNRQTLTLFRAPDKATLLHRLPDIFRDEMRRPFTEQLIELWEGKLYQQRETVNYALDGEMLHVHLQFAVLPGHEHDWSLVQVSLTDITARKKAEAYLEFLGKHDALTRLRNRSFFDDELNRLERKNVQPVALLLLDLNGLKQVNDEQGHRAGDALLRRVGEVLGQAVEAPSTAARIGGDEFAVLIPGGDQAAAEALIAQLQGLVDINNQFHAGTPLSFSVGVAVSRPGERLEAALHRADKQMYQQKKAYYEACRATAGARTPAERRAPPSALVSDQVGGGPARPDLPAWAGQRGPRGALSMNTPTRPPAGRRTSTRICTGPSMPRWRCTRAGPICCPPCWPRPSTASTAMWPSSARTSRRWPATAAAPPAAPCG